MEQRGFSLLELLVTVTIMSVLIATAIPQYRKYREKGYDIRAESDLRNVAIAEEAYFLDHEAYLACQDQSCTTLPSMNSLSDGVHLQILVDNDRFTGTASHEKGSGKEFVWDSDKGGIVEE